LPTYIVAHGIVLTLWFLIFLVQTILIALRRVSRHRLLGPVVVGTATLAGFSEFGQAFVKALA
jgi:hypothetical protein